MVYLISDNLEDKFGFRTIEQQDVIPNRLELIVSLNPVNDCLSGMLSPTCLYTMRKLNMNLRKSYFNLSEQTRSTWFREIDFRHMYGIG